jgi:hypothetical protein
VSKPGAADDGIDPFDLEEFPAFPDLTIPLLGGIDSDMGVPVLAAVTP